MLKKNVKKEAGMVTAINDINSCISEISPISQNIGDIINSTSNVLGGSASGADARIIGQLKMASDMVGNAVNLLQGSISCIQSVNLMEEVPDEEDR